MAARNMSDPQLRREVALILSSTELEYQLMRVRSDHVRITVMPDGNGKVPKKRSFVGRPDRVKKELEIFAAELRQ